MVDLNGEYEPMGAKYTMLELRQAISEIAETLGHLPSHPISLQLLLLELELDKTDHEKLLVIIRDTLKSQKDFNLKDYSEKINAYLEDTKRGPFVDSVIYGLLHGYSKHWIPELYPFVYDEWEDGIY